jgi:hypothetical protein
MTIISQNPRQIAAFEVCRHRTKEKIQEMVDRAPKGKRYCTDGFNGYVGIDFPGIHVRNCCDKADIANTLENKLIITYLFYSKND